MWWGNLTTVYYNYNRVNLTLLAITLSNSFFFQFFETYDHSLNWLGKKVLLSFVLLLLLSPVITYFASVCCELFPKPKPESAKSLATSMRKRKTVLCKLVGTLTSAQTLSLALCSQPGRWVPFLEMPSILYYSFVCTCLTSSRFGIFARYRFFAMALSWNNETFKKLRVKVKKLWIFDPWFLYSCLCLFCWCTCLLVQYCLRW